MVGLICIDGPAGAGKTTLATRLADFLESKGSCRIIHMDDLYDGWTGIQAGRDQLHLRVLRPLAAGQEGTYHRYDWHLATYAEQHVVTPTDWLIIEGCGSWSVAWADLVTALVWVEADPATCQARGLERDGESVRDHWPAWEQTQAALYATESTRDFADLIIATG